MRTRQNFNLYNPDTDHSQDGHTGIGQVSLRISQLTEPVLIDTRTEFIICLCQIETTIFK